MMPMLLKTSDVGYKRYTKDQTERAILNLHFTGKTPAEIDSELNLRKGTAHKVITDYWNWDSSMYVVRP